jgi:hypothetical protein
VGDVPVWFKGNISKEDAERRLLSMLGFTQLLARPNTSQWDRFSPTDDGREGVFLVRSSQTMPGQNVLSFVVNRAVCHVRIQMTPSGQFVLAGMGGDTTGASGCPKRTAASLWRSAPSMLDDMTAL